MILNDPVSRAGARWLVAVLLLAGIPFRPAAAQCSDAGICSIGGPEHTASVLTVEAGALYGRSGQDDFTFTDLRLRAVWRPDEALTISAGVPFRRMTGPLGSTNGIGDVLGTVSVRVYDRDGMSISVDGGIRLATGDVNAGGLPAAYQPGLGTTDGLFGVSVSWDRWSAGAAYQVSRGRSDNAINRLQRGDDLSLRASYTHPFDDSALRAEILMIHKPSVSSVLLPLPNQPPSLIPSSFGPLPGSDQTQINLVGEWSGPIADPITFAAQAAVAMLSRPVNIDGLTRGFSAAVTFSVPVL